MHNIAWVINIDPTVTQSLIEEATKLASKVQTISLMEGKQKGVQGGVAKNIEITSDSTLLEDYMATLVETVNSEDNFIVVLPNNRLGKSIGVVLSEKSNGVFVSDVQEVAVEGDSLICQRMMYGGLAVATEKVAGDKVIVALKDAVSIGVDEVAPTNADVVTETISCAPSTGKVVCVKRIAKEKQEVDLRKAKRIIAVGRGVKEEKDLQMIYDLAQLLNAEVGCSRPISETEKWMPHERYIGISSVAAKPELYIAIGISGQIQHMVAIKDADKIIAINSDKEAPIFGYADVGIVGDLYKVVPALLEKLK